MSASHKAMQEVRRKECARGSMEALKAANIRFRNASSGFGRKLIVIEGKRMFDFWPTTGSWRERMPAAPGSFDIGCQVRKEGTSVATLVALIKADRLEPSGSRPDLRSDGVPEQAVGVQVVE